MSKYSEYRIMGMKIEDQDIRDITTICPTCDANNTVMHKIGVRTVIKCHSCFASYSISTLVMEEIIA